MDINQQMKMYSKNVNYIDNWYRCLEVKHRNFFKIEIVLPGLLTNQKLISMLHCFTSSWMFVYSVLQPVCCVTIENWLKYGTNKHSTSSNLFQNLLLLMAITLLCNQMFRNKISSFSHCIVNSSVWCDKTFILWKLWCCRTKLQNITLRKLVEYWQMLWS